MSVTFSRGWCTHDGYILLQKSHVFLHTSTSACITQNSWSSSQVEICAFYVYYKSFSSRDICIVFPVLHLSQVRNITNSLKIFYSGHFSCCTLPQPDISWTFWLGGWEEKFNETSQATGKESKSSMLVWNLPLSVQIVCWVCTWCLTCLLMSAPAWSSHNRHLGWPPNAAMWVGVCANLEVTAFTPHPTWTRRITHSSCVETGEEWMNEEVKHKTACWQWSLLIALEEDVTLGGDRPVKQSVWLRGTSATLHSLCLLRAFIALGIDPIPAEYSPALFPESSPCKTNLTTSLWAFGAEVHKQFVTNGSFAY